MRNRGRVVARGARGGGGKAQRQQKKDQQLFSESFIPEQSRHLDVQADSTFAAEADKTFDLHYADGSHLRGFTGKSVVALGDYEAEAPFGVITDCNSPDFNGVDGILGFGLPHRGRNMPRPILFAVTDANPDLPLKFSFYSTDDDAEVVLGGYDPSSVSEAMWCVPRAARATCARPSRQGASPPSQRLSWTRPCAPQPLIRIRIGVRKKKICSPLIRQP